MRREGGGTERKGRGRGAWGWWGEAEAVRMAGFGESGEKVRVLSIAQSCYGGAEEKAYYELFLRQLVCGRRRRDMEKEESGRGNERYGYRLQAARMGCAECECLQECVRVRLCERCTECERARACA
eukprot:5335530-Pleurochrysis_carterae.AAC.2